MKLQKLPEVSNREDFIEVFEVLDEETSSAIDLTSATISVGIEDPETGTTMLTGSTTDGKVTLTDSNFKFQVTFLASSMAGLDAKDYVFGFLITAGSETRQGLIGYLPVLRGIPQ